MYSSDCCQCNPLESKFRFSCPYVYSIQASRLSLKISLVDIVYLPDWPDSLLGKNTGRICAFVRKNKLVFCVIACFSSSTGFVCEHLTNFTPCFLDSPVVLSIRCCLQSKTFTQRNTISRISSDLENWAKNHSANEWMNIFTSKILYQVWNFLMQRTSFCKGSFAQKEKDIIFV